MNHLYKLADVDLTELAAHYRAGLVSTEIAALYGCSYQSIRYHLKKIGRSDQDVGRFAQAKAATDSTLQAVRPGFLSPHKPPRYCSSCAARRDRSISVGKLEGLIAPPRSVFATRRKSLIHGTLKVMKLINAGRTVA